MCAKNDVSKSGEGPQAGDYEAPSHTIFFRTHVSVRLLDADAGFQIFHSILSFPRFASSLSKPRVATDPPPHGRIKDLPRCVHALPTSLLHKAIRYDVKGSAHEGCVRTGGEQSKGIGKSTGSEVVCTVQTIGLQIRGIKK